MRDKVRQGALEAARIIDEYQERLEEYKQRLTQIIEEEGEEIRRESETEAASIIAAAREEGEEKKGRPRTRPPVFWPVPGSLPSR